MKPLGYTNIVELLNNFNTWERYEYEFIDINTYFGKILDRINCFIYEFRVLL